MRASHRATTRKNAPAAFRRSAGAFTALVLALGGIAVTEAAANPAETDAPAPLWSLDFENVLEGSEVYPWGPSGSPGLEIATDPEAADNHVLAVTRKSDFDGIQSPAGSYFTPGKTYNFSMRARLSADGPSGREVRFVMKPAFNWIGNTMVTADGWTTVNVIWSAPSDATSDALQVYIGIGAPGSTDEYTVLVDDIVVTERGSEPTLTVSDSDNAFVPGDKVTVSGTDFAPNSAVTVSFEQNGEVVTGGSTSIGAKADNIGWFSHRTISLPTKAAPGDLTVIARDGTTSAEMTIAVQDASVTTKTPSVPTRGQLDVEGSGFLPNTTVTISAPSVTTVKVTANDEGVFGATLTAPSRPTPALTITATGPGNPITRAETQVEITAVVSREPTLEVFDPEDPVDEYDFVLGDIVTFYGSGFTAGQTVTVSTTIVNGYFAPVTVRVGDDGTFTATGVKFENYWNPGELTFTAVQGATAAERKVTIKSPAVTATPSAVGAGGVVTISGTGFIANVELQVSVAGQNQSVQADAEGRFTTKITAPATVQSLTITASQWGRSCSTTVNVTASDQPAITLSADSVVQGGTFTVVGHQFGPEELVEISFDKIGMSSVLTSDFTTSSGSFPATVIDVPDGTEPGTLNVTATGGVSGRTATATITVLKKPAPDYSRLAGPATVDTNTPFTLTGSAFPVRTTVTLELLHEGDVVGGATVATDGRGAFTQDVAIPYGVVLDGEVVTIKAVGYAAEHRVTVTNVANGKNPQVRIDAGAAVLKPGDAVAFSWTDLTPGHVAVTMRATLNNALVSVGDGPLIADSTGTGAGEVAIRSDVLPGTGEWTVTVTATQGMAHAETTVRVRNHFSGYHDAYDAARKLVQDRNNGVFSGITASWGQLDSLIASNEFLSASEAQATQAISDRVEAQLRAAVQSVAESLLQARVAAATEVLDAYADAAAVSPTMTEVIAGGARAVVESLIAEAERALVPTPADIKQVWRDDVVSLTFDDSTSPPDYPEVVQTEFEIVPDPRDGSTGNVLSINRYNDWEGLHLDGTQFAPGETCRFTADVGYGVGEDGGGRSELDIRFLANYREGTSEQDSFTWIGNKIVPRGQWVTLDSTWTVPDGVVGYVRLVAGHQLNGEFHEFLADNVRVSCYTNVTVTPETHQPPSTLLSLEEQLRAAVKGLSEALASSTGGQAPWAPAPGQELGWTDGDGVYTDHGIARWIGRNLYIRGNASELEGRTVVMSDVDVNKQGITGWAGFNFGTVSIGSQIALSGDEPALVVCDDLRASFNGLWPDVNINGATLAVGGAPEGPIRANNGWSSAEPYCSTYAGAHPEGDPGMADKVRVLSEALAKRSTADDEDCNCTSAPGGSVEAEVAGGTLLLKAGTPDADGLYVFHVAAEALAGATKIVIEGLQVDQSPPSDGGRIASMRPAVINVLGDKRIDWTVESIYLRDENGDQLYAGDKFWHPDLGKVAGALMWNFPDVMDGRAQPAHPDAGLVIDDGITSPSVEPRVTLRTSGLGVNFLGSILIPNASLETVNISLNGRLYVGGDYLMNDTLTKRVGDPLFDGGYYPDGGGDLLGHAEGHNYPWWFTPETAAPAGQLTIGKVVSEKDAADILDIAGQAVGSMFATGRLRCMHIEDASRLGVTPQSAGWWDPSLARDPYLLTVDATWWVKVGETITLDDVPYGTLCSITEDLGLFEAFDASNNPVTKSGISGRLPRGSVTSTQGCPCAETDGPAVPRFVGPASIPAGFAWALPKITFDDAPRAVTVTEEGPTASLLLRTESSEAPVAQIMNSLAPLGRATISKTVASTEDLGAPIFAFTWSTALDGYVQVGKREDGGTDRIPGSYLIPDTRTGTVMVAADGQAQSPQYCPDTAPAWWPQDRTDGAWWEPDRTTPKCQHLWFLSGATLTWAEVGKQHQINGTWYDVQRIEYGGGQTVTLKTSDVVETTVVNTLVKAPARFAVQKAVHGTGSNLVPASTEFTITYEAWQDRNGNGTIDAGDLRLNAGTPGGPPCQDSLVIRADGKAVTSVDYPDDTLIRLAEAPPPTIANVTWGDPQLSATTFALTYGGEIPTVTVTNTAHGPASFSLSKELPADNVGTAWKIDFDLAYDVSDKDGRPLDSGRKTHTLAYGVDTTRETVTKIGNHTLQIGDIVTVSEPADGFDTGFNWDKNGYTVEVRNAKGELLTSCKDRGLESGCSRGAFRITEDTVNSLVVTVVNRLVGAPVMPMSGGPLAAWMALTSGLALAAIWSLTRAQSLRRPRTRGGAMR